MRPKRFRTVLISLIMILFAGSGHPQTEEKLLPLPLREVEHLLTRWLLQSGFEVYRKEQEGHEVHLKGMERERTVLELVLRPKSALATSIQIHPKGVEAKPSQEILANLNTFLKAHFSEPGPERIPPKVQQRLEALVCLWVTNGKETMQFTGFIVDRKGLILSTAHDLRGVSEVAVSLPDGRVERGSIRKIDLRRDLILIVIRTRWNASIPLVPVRRSLQNGERVYAISCPNHEKRFLSGTIDGPLRWVHDLPLYQAEMEIQPGSSGSPVFDGEGNLVGMIKGRYRGISAIGFLIPVTTLLEFMKD